MTNPNKIPVGVLGATGAVGQRFIQLLAHHPWFEISAVAASDRSSGKRFAEACHWLLPTRLPQRIGALPVQSIQDRLDCQIVFSALPSQAAASVEEAFAQAGYLVCSNASAHRMDADVPLLIPEVNPGHTALIKEQRRQRGWKGSLVTSANCMATALTLALKPLHEAFGLQKLHVVSLQAVSGAGYPGVPSLDMIDNVIPFISGEESKIESEPQKMLGTLQTSRIAPAPFATSAQSNRVPVRDGHVACVSIRFQDKPDLQTLLAALEQFRAPPQIAELPSSPPQPIVLRREPDRPQPVRDRAAGEGMAVSVGRVRPCPLFDYRLVVLGHNTLRGAAGGAIHNAELLVAQKWIK